MEILFSNKKSGRERTKEFFEKKNFLANNNIDNIIDTLNEISKYWVSKNFKLEGDYILGGSAAAA